MTCNKLYLVVNAFVTMKYTLAQDMKIVPVITAHFLTVKSFVGCKECTASITTCNHIFFILKDEPGSILRVLNALLKLVGGRFK
jgi:hypothetical protein